MCQSKACGVICARMNSVLMGGHGPSMSNGAASRLHSRVGALLQALLALGQSLVLADSHVCVSVWQLKTGVEKVASTRKKSVNSRKPSRPNSVRAFLGFPETAKEARSFVPSSDHQMWHASSPLLFRPSSSYIFTSRSSCTLDRSIGHL